MSGFSFQVQGEAAKMSNEPPPPYPGGPTAPLLEEKSGAPPTPGRGHVPGRGPCRNPSSFPLPRCSWASMVSLLQDHLVSKNNDFRPAEPPLSLCPGRTSPAVMQPPPGMPLPPSDIGPPPYEPPGHPMPQPGFVPPHMGAEGAYMPPGKLGRDLRGVWGQLLSSLHCGQLAINHRLWT